MATAPKRGPSKDAALFAQIQQDRLNVQAQIERSRIGQDAGKSRPVAAELFSIVHHKLKTSLWIVVLIALIGGSALLVFWALSRHA